MLFASLMRCPPICSIGQGESASAMVVGLAADGEIRIMDFAFLEQDSLSRTQPSMFCWIGDRPTVLVGPSQLHYISSSVPLDAPRLGSNRDCCVWIGAGPDRGLILLQEPTSHAVRRDSPD